MRRKTTFAALAFLALAGLAGAARAADPDALWKIIDTQCVPNEREYGQASPCAVVDIQAGVEHGYVVLKDRTGDTQYLVMPTAKITGIEDPAILAPSATNYFAAAWHERHYTVEATKMALPRNALSLAINSAHGRSQNQLHIHIDCARADVRDAVLRQLAKIGDKWAPLAEPLAGHSYRAIRVSGEELDGTNPFTLLADGVPGARAAMGDHTLVVIGENFADGTPGFVILDDHASATDHASGEELQDHLCGLSHP